MLHGSGRGGVPLPVVRHITRQLLVALDFLHRECGIVHTGERQGCWRGEQLSECGAALGSFCASRRW